MPAFTEEDADAGAFDIVPGVWLFLKTFRLKQGVFYIECLRVVDFAFCSEALLFDNMSSYDSSIWIP